MSTYNTNNKESPIVSFDQSRTKIQQEILNEIQNKSLLLLLLGEKTEELYKEVSKDIKDLLTEREEALKRVNFLNGEIEIKENILIPLNKEVISVKSLKEKINTLNPIKTLTEENLKKSSSNTWAGKLCQPDEINTALSCASTSTSTRFSTSTHHQRDGKIPTPKKPSQLEGYIKHEKTIYGALSKKQLRTNPDYDFYSDPEYSNLTFYQIDKKIKNIFSYSFVHTFGPSLGDFDLNGFNYIGEDDDFYYYDSFVEKPNDDFNNVLSKITLPKIWNSTFPDFKKNISVWCLGR
jgi:uncharacterized protein YoxC